MIECSERLYHFQKRRATGSLNSRAKTKSFSSLYGAPVKALVKESAAPGFKLKDVPEPRIRELRHLFTARGSLVSIGRGLKNMGHAALARNGIAVTRAAFATETGRRRLARYVCVCQQ